MVPRQAIWKRDPMMGVCSIWATRPSSTATCHDSKTSQGEASELTNFDPRPTVFPDLEVESLLWERQLHLTLAWSPWSGRMDACLARLTIRQPISQVQYNPCATKEAVT
jgi:hypothetical protein